jgi:hypothetical protein
MKKSKKTGYDLNNMRDRFVLFLKRHDLLIPFIVNHAIRNEVISGSVNRITTETFFDYLERVDPLEYMDRGFLKKDTAEGESFWQWYSMKWKAVHRHNVMYWKFVQYYVEIPDGKYS